MPLAIIGNEYDKAWNQVKEEVQQKEEKKLRDEVNFNDKVDQSLASASLLPRSTVVAKRKALDNEKAALSSPVMSSLLHLRSLVREALQEGVQSIRLTPRGLMLFCEVKAWIPALYLLIKQRYDNIYAAGGLQGAYALPNYFPGALQEMEVALRKKSTATESGSGRRMSLFNRTPASAAASLQQFHATRLPAVLENSLLAVERLEYSIAHRRREKEEDDLPEPYVPISERIKNAIKSFPSNVKGFFMDLFSKRSLEEDHLLRMEEAYAHPNKLRNRLWILLEVPQSSSEARILQTVLVFLVFLSMFVLYTQTVLILSPYGETALIC